LKREAQDNYEWTVTYLSFQGLSAVFLADRTNGHAYGTICRPSVHSVVCRLSV